MMTNKLEMPLEQFAEAVAKENERLISGPGGIMEMKQTIADKEKLIEKLENQFKLYFHAFNKAADRIEKLEAALREMLIRCTNTGRWCGPIDCHCRIARKALGGKEPLEWTENYGQGAEPWLEDTK
jgi:hypothetical protein